MTSVISDSFEGRWSDYLTTQVRIRMPEHVLEVRSMTGGTIGNFPNVSGNAIHIMTAHNPGRQLTDEQNARRQQELVSQVEGRKGVTWWQAVGGDPQWRHVEDSIAVTSLTEQQALDLARQYQQDAILAWSPDQWRLLACDESLEHSTGWRAFPLTMGTWPPHPS
ncbi:MAG: DUF3293 domain-containing protein [Candidatus Nanopelagicales bacterium]